MTTETPEALPAKKTAAKKTAAKTPGKKADAPPPAPVADKDVRSVYLPALPEGFAYTHVEVTGPDGAQIVLNIDTTGKAVLAFKGANLNREQTYPNVKDGAKAIGKAAKGIATVIEREAELARLREEAFDL